MVIIHTIVHFGIGRCVSYLVWIGQTLEFAFLMLVLNDFQSIQFRLLPSKTIILYRIYRQFRRSKYLPGTVPNWPSDSL